MSLCTMDKLWQKQFKWNPYTRTLRNKNIIRFCTNVKGLDDIDWSEITIMQTRLETIIIYAIRGLLKDLAFLLRNEQIR